MLQVIGNLSERGLAFFLDRDLKYELVQNSQIHIDQDDSVELFIGLKHRYEGDMRYGKIIFLEENCLAFSVDLIEEVQGEAFRNFDNIENIELEVEFDVHAFLRNLLIGLMDKQFYHVLEFISNGHMNTSAKCFWLCACEPDRRKIVDCEGGSCGKDIFGEDIPKWKFKPDGWWGQEELPPGGYYNFLTEYFYENGGEPDRVRFFEQWMYHSDITRMLTNKYLDNGYKSYESMHHLGSHNVSFNYINDIYPEQTELMDYRWKYGGYDITWLEYKLKKTYVYKTFQDWYVGKLSPPEKLYTFMADEMTVRGHTDIAKTNTRAIFYRDEHILEELLGPKECLDYDNDGFCTLARYGELNIIDNDADFVEMFGTTVWFISAEDYIDNLTAISEWPEGEVPEHQFKVMYDYSFEALPEAYINGSEYRALCETPHGIHPTNAFYSVEHSDGKIGGKYIYRNAYGNEHRYFMRFRDFLSEQGWTIDDFMDIYPLQMLDREYEIMHNATTSTHFINRDFSEFYDKNHKAPFDGIEHYTPLIPTFDPKLTGQENVLAVSVEKRKVMVDEYGVETIVDIDGESILPGDFTTSINKDEFVSDISIDNSLRAFISDYMRVRIKIKFDGTYPTTQEVKLRISASDFTYLQTREFKYYE